MGKDAQAEADGMLGEAVHTEDIDKATTVAVAEVPRLG